MVLIKNKKENLVNLMFIILGTIFLSMSINIFYEPNNVVVGGFSGLGIIIQRLTENLIEGGIPISVTNFVLNIPLFIIALKVLGTKYVAKTAMATVLFSVVLEIGSFLPKYYGDFILISIFGGIIDGIGVGFILRAAASTGGVDLLATLIYRKFRHVPLSRILLIINAAILFLGVYAFGVDRGMYGIISIVVSTKCINLVLEGLSFSKVAFIISKESDKIAEIILQKHLRGVTAIHGKGMYTKTEKDILFCVFSQKEFVLVKETIMKIDPNAFLIVSDVREVMGEGFKKLTLD